MLLCSTDIFLPTPDSLLVNLNECKEVGISCLVLSCRFRIMSCEPWTETREWENLTVRVLILSSQPVNVYNPHPVISSSLCRICWRAYLLYLKRPWKPSLHWVQRCRLASSCYRLQEAAWLSSRHNCRTSVQGPCSPEKTPTRGHLLR